MLNSIQYPQQSSTFPMSTSSPERLEPSHGRDLGGSRQAIGHVRELDLAAGGQKSWCYARRSGGFHVNGYPKP